MEATYTTALERPRQNAAANGLRAARRLVRALGRGIGHALVHYSRAALLLRGGPRPARRL